MMSDLLLQKNLSQSALSAATLQRALPVCRRLQRRACRLPVVRAESAAQEEAVKRALADPATRKQMEAMEQQMKDPMMQAQMGQMQAAMRSPELQRKVAGLREDPELAGIFQEIEKGGVAAMIKAMNNPEILHKIGAKMGDVDLGPGAEGPPPPPAAASVPEINNILDAAKAGDLEAVEDFLAVGRDVNEQDANQCTPLHLAVAFNRAEVVSELLRSGADVSLTDAKGNTPLHYASGYGRAALVKALVQAGASGALQNDNGETPLDLATGDERNPVQKDEEALEALENSAMVE